MPTVDDTSGARHLVASFDEAGRARDAMVALESLGIDAEAIRIVDGGAAGRQPGTAGSRMSQDAEAAAERAGEQRFEKNVVGNYAKGAVVSAVVLGVVAGLVVLALGMDPLAVGLAALGGAIAGFVLGGYINAARQLPVNVDALDTYAMEQRSDGSVEVEVRLDDSLADEAEAVLRKHDATEVRRGS